jgi:hypothetical protein
MGIRGLPGAQVCLSGLRTSRRGYQGRLYRSADQAGAQYNRNETSLSVLEITWKQIPAHIRIPGRTSPEGDTNMNAAIAWLLPRVSAKSAEDIESFISIALFCGVGLLLSLSVLIADQYIPGEWF